MLRVLFILLGLSPLFSYAHAQSLKPPQPLGAALDAAEAKDWRVATALAERAGGGVARDLVTWTRLRTGEGTPGEVMSFLTRRADWPGLALLRRRSEAAMASARRSQILQFYQTQAPQTGVGALSYAQALRAAGKSRQADEVLITAWRTLALKPEELAAFTARHNRLLSRHYTARLDMALWKGWTQNAKAVLPLVDAGWQNLAAARMGLRAKAKNVDGLINAVPGRLAKDPGLAYERYRWRMAKGRYDDAATLMLERSRAKTLGEPESWARSRRDLVRRLMRNGQSRLAYQLASSHGLNSGSNYADLEWLSGYLALRYQKRPGRARAHFQNFQGAVFTPISLGRAGYWLGRAEEAAGNNSAAKRHYTQGAQYQTSFYGLLAAERGGIGFDQSLVSRSNADWRNAGFRQSSVFQAAHLLIAAGETSLAERFLRHLAETLSEAELDQLGAYLNAQGQPHIAVMVGKEAAKRGITIADPYYALHPLKDMRLPVGKELALAIARRESEFDPRVVSHAGAQGLMQVMPATAKRVAASLNIAHQPGKMLSDWRYNVTLGSAYLAQMSQRFGGNIVLISAAYNAGPGRPDRWITTYGDPRRRGQDIVDWIEMIPFNETRNYVMRVSESLPVYRARLGLRPHPVPFSQELKGSTF